jgi:hypothetical protein
LTWQDGDGQDLDGTRAYTMRFDTTPPVDVGSTPSPAPNGEG